MQWSSSVRNIFDFSIKFFEEFPFFWCNWFGPYPITLLTNAIAKGCGFLRASCWCLLHNKIPSNTIRCMHNAATKMHRSDIVCATGKEKHMKTNPEHVKNWRKKSSPSAIEFSEHFHCSCVGSAVRFFSLALMETFFTSKTKSFGIDF